MQERVLATLEFNKVLDRLAQFCSFSLSREGALALRPSTDYQEVVRRQRHTAADAGPRDLRPLLEDAEVLEVDEESGRARLRLVLRLDASGAGRPEDVVGALDLPLRSGPAVRTRLLFVDTPPIAR